MKGPEDKTRLQALLGFLPLGSWWKFLDTDPGWGSGRTGSCKGTAAASDPKNQHAGNSSQPREDGEADMTGRADGQDRRSPVVGAEDLVRLQRMEPFTDAST